MTKTDDIVNAVEMAKSMGRCASWSTRRASAGPATIGKDGQYDSAFNLDAFSKVIAINLIGTFDCIRIAATAMSTTEPSTVASGARS
ncbi:MAG: hypothetical protein R2705_11720 [Ilumatobacteraceae bacterium]